MSELVEQVGRGIAKRRWFVPARGVLLAVSGGVDSMVLLEVFARLAAAHRWPVAVAHFNHRLRGRASDADERFVAAAARKAGLKFVRGEDDVRGRARKRGVSIEMAARELRHAFLARTALRLGLQAIALAHHADDQVELFFLRLLRGAGVEGLAGMRWRGVSPADRRVTLVRPLLDRTREELRAFAAEEGIAFREDATNAQLDFQRNRIRHELLPLLRRHYQPALSRVILRQMEILRDENDWLARETAEIVARMQNARRAPAFDKLPPAIQRRCLRVQAMEQGIDADFDIIESLRERAGREISVGGVQVWRDERGRVHVRPRTSQTGDSRESLKTKFNPKRREVLLEGGRKTRRRGSGGNTLVFDGVEVTWRVVDRAGGPIAKRSKLVDCECFDADKVGSGVVLRHWQPGDRFQPIGMAGAVKLQDLFTNQKVLRAERHELIVGANRGGEIFWVEGLRMGERFKLDAATRRQLQWTWKRLK